MSTTTRDKRVADDASIDRAGMCAASHCPNRWSVDGGNGRLCSAHAWSDRAAWPRITQDLLDAETERALAAAVDQSQPPVTPPRLTRADKTAILERLRNIDFSRQSGKAWATALRTCAPSGQKLTQAQAEMCRAAIGLIGADEPENRAAP